MSWFQDVQIKKLEQRIDRFEDLSNQRWRWIMTQLSDLSDNITALGTDIDGALTHLSTVEDELTNANNQLANNQPVDLTAVNNAVTALRQKLESAANTAANTTVPTDPSPTPASTDGTTQQPTS